MDNLSLCTERDAHEHFTKHAGDIAVTAARSNGTSWQQGCGPERSIARFLCIQNGSRLRTVLPTTQTPSDQIWNCPHRNWRVPAIPSCRWLHFLTRHRHGLHGPARRPKQKNIRSAFRALRRRSSRMDHACTQPPRLTMQSSSMANRQRSSTSMLPGSLAQGTS